MIAELVQSQTRISLTHRKRFSMPTMNRTERRLCFNRLYAPLLSVGQRLITAPAKAIAAANRNAQR